MLYGKNSEGCINLCCFVCVCIIWRKLACQFFGGHEFFQGNLCEVADNHNSFGCCRDAIQGIRKRTVISILVDYPTCIFCHFGL